MAVTVDQVKAIVDTARDVTPFLTTATLLATEQLQDKGLTADSIDQITLYLAAHFVVLTEENGGVTLSRTGTGEERYKTPGATQEGLASTRFGQAAMMFDTSGTLASMNTNGKLKARFNLIAQPRCYWGFWNV